MALSLTRTPSIRRLGVPDPAVPAVETLLETVTNTWSVSPETARVLASYIAHDGCSRVIEFGAGVSSRVIAAALHAKGGGTLTSVEENPVWSAEAWAHMEAESPTVDAQLVEASVHLVVDARGPYYGYSHRQEIARRGPYDLVFIDAPSGAYGRDGSLYACIASLAPGALIVLDDAARFREQRVVARWLSAYPELEVVANDPDVGRGVAVLRAPSGSPSLRSLPIRAWGSGLYDRVRYVRAVQEYRRESEAFAPAS